MLLGQMDAGTAVGLGTVCVSLLGMLGWVLREVIGQNRESTAYIKASTEVLVSLKDESQGVKESMAKVAGDVAALKDIQDGRPCAFMKQPELVEWLRPTQAAAAKG